ncbi:Alpha/Beta hydrolase protein [Podospora didyma]|uniref:Alpha/Beta hydrolase protein n=1 Tax=Podospora didyma TaxID=330526 RepID=A0AAE0KF71_9PEZI|nr:Alpha/Beta hydrolase protein [Podospora didyma]
MEAKSISLDTKPGATLRISIYFPPCTPGTHVSNTLVVFLNGLVLPRSSWTESINHLLALRQSSSQPTPALLSYDRYGQGDSDPDPTDPPDTPYGHDLLTSAADLYHLLTQVVSPTLLPTTNLIFVCNSIGCALARLYAAAHPDYNIAGLLFLDSMVANSDYVSLFPDPDGGSQITLPPDVSVESLRHARAMFTKFFHPTVPNAERLDRRRLAELLPDADRPVLPTRKDNGGRTPRLVVVGHDWDEFAEQCETGSMAVQKSVINAYLNPAWGAYNEGLTRLVQHPDNIGSEEDQVKIAKGCGHFIQRDDPLFVATEINSFLNELAEQDVADLWMYEC